MGSEVWRLVERLAMVEKRGIKQVKDLRPTVSEVDWGDWRPSDEDRPKVRHVVIKSVENEKLEFEQRNQYLVGLPASFQLDLEEIDCREFLSWVFERNMNYKRDVEPFEDIMSREYQLWLKQNKAGVKDIDYCGYSCWRYNPVLFYSENKKGHHRIILRDDEETMSFIEGRKFALMAPITYVGRTNTSVSARYLYALGFDLDGVGIKQLRALVRMMQDDYMPLANIITSSGHGLHLYYLLDKPMPLYRENLPILNKLKHGLTNLIWNDKTSFYEDRQHQSVFQGFRLPGTLTKFGEVIRCFHVLDAPMYSVEKLNGYLSAFKLKEDELKQLHKTPTYNPDRTPMEKAKDEWPEWYAARILRKERVGRKWHIKRDVYDWWLKRLSDTDDEIKVHHRYWCILTLVVYAVKCDIPREEVYADACSLVDKMDSYTEEEDNHFSVEDVDDAMKAYDNNYNKWPIHTIEATTLLHIERNRRNGRKQDEHLLRARMLRDLDHPNGSWINRKGRPKNTYKSIENSEVAHKVIQWRKEHPASKNKSACARDLNLVRNTVIKWWDGTDRIAEKQWERQKMQKKASSRHEASQTQTETKAEARDKFIIRDGDLIMIDPSRIKSDADMQEAMKELQEAIRVKDSKNAK